MQSVFLGIVRVASVHAAGLYILVVLVPHPLHNNFGVAPTFFRPGYKGIAQFVNTIAHVSGTMSSYNAIGACYTARNGALLTDVVRGEWGFDGFFITDAGSCTDTPILTMAMGTDQFCLSIGSDLVMDALNASSDGYGAQLLRASAKRILYAYANSLAINGLSEDVVISEGTSWWVVTLYVLDAVFAVVAVASLGMFVYSAYFSKRGKKA